MRKDPAFAKDYLEPIGYEAYPDDEKFPDGVYTVYGYPEEINYPPLRRKKNWFNFEVFNMCETKNLVKLNKLIPTEFLDDTLDGKFSGKLIYLSMGTMGSVDLDLMNRLVDVLGKTNHKYIVSKGPRHSEYSLAPNMWGDRYLLQTKIVPLVDLVITHGGNNTVTETFSQGKAMICLPLFADQFDNAQRLHETGYGVRIDPYDFKDRQLVSAIDQLLGDKVLHQKLHIAKERIQNLNKFEEFALKVEQLLG